MVMKEIIRKIYLWFNSSKWENEKPFVLIALLLLIPLLYSVFYIKSTEFTFLRAAFTCWFAYCLIKYTFGLIGIVLIKIALVISTLLDKAKCKIKTNIENYLEINK